MVKNVKSVEAKRNRIVVPVRYAAWLSGDLGRTLERTLAQELEAAPNIQVTRLPRGFLVEADESSGVLLENVHQATVRMEKAAEEAYPVFHHEMGPIWTGTLQAIYDVPAGAT